jgi:hypothetical protein
MTLLPLIILPILALGLAAYQRARILIRDQVVGQLGRTAGAQVDSFIAWGIAPSSPGSPGRRLWRSFG